MREKRAQSRIYPLAVAAQLAFFVDAAVLLIPSAGVRGVVTTATSPLIVVVAAMLMFNWRNATSDFKGEVVSREYQWAVAARDWPGWYWRSIGLCGMIIGLTILGFGIVWLFA